MTVGCSKLSSYLNKNIRDICPNHFDDNNLNHCAHFVSHMLGIGIGYTCTEWSREAMAPRPTSKFKNSLECGVRR